ncbi:hypothetical protein IWQ52_004784 [Labrenzia sp. EL_159]|nr:hypothetical protein [Labrenzia sp. EL_162]MBG6197237.1 hypothetical protein [Labrenzia sp. EL_159]
MTRLALFALAWVATIAFSQPGAAGSERILRERASGISSSPGSASLPFPGSLATAAQSISSFSGQSNAISWKELRPKPLSIETPFADFPEPLLEAMRTHVRWRTSSKRDRSDEAFIAEHDAAMALLADHDIDVENLMRERRKLIARNSRIARRANPNVLGETIRLPGYVVPLAFDDRVVTEFLFVPVAGACVHTPTPPPNQIVHVTYPEGIGFSSIFNAFWVEGELLASETQNDVVFHDGAASGVKAIYALNATSVGSISR